MAIAHGRIIKGISALAKESGPEALPCDADEAAQEIRVLFQSEIRRPDIPLETALSNDISLLIDDRIPLQQITFPLALPGRAAMTTIIGRRRGLAGQRSAPPL
ncbi:MAG: hypothetical protein WDN49_07215 [Acetobacteraceae bacterium]